MDPHSLLGFQHAKLKMCSTLTNQNMKAQLHRNSDVVPKGVAAVWKSRQHIVRILEVILDHHVASEAAAGHRGLQNRSWRRTLSMFLPLARLKTCVTEE